MRYLVLIVAVCLIPSLACAAGEKSTAPFLSIFSCDEANPKAIDEEICLVGELKEGQAVYLLSDTVVCRAEAQEAEMLEREVGPEFMITPVDLGDCDTADYYLAWHGKKPAGFRPLSLVQETSVTTRSKVDSAIRKGHLTEEMLAAFEGTIEVAPVLYRLFAKQPDSFLVQYITSQPLQEGDMYGPVFWYTKGRVELIDPQASITAYFRMQGDHFLLLRHECWQGCGEVSEQVFKVSEKGFAPVYHNDAFSD